MLTPQPIRRQRTNEQIFFEHYSRILEWASQLTHLDRADAEDLVQDFYIQVKCMNVPLAAVEEIEPYLFKILRNLHYTRLRRKGRSPISELSIAEYDSLERGLVATNGRDLLTIHADLKRICEYACRRKTTAARASVFILRFFFGYRPSEVMRVVLASRTAVDRALLLSRQEAQQYFDRAHTAPGDVPREQQTLSLDTEGDPSHAIFLELRQMIFNASEGPCFERLAIEKRYDTAPATRFMIRELSHLVSCKSCLDRANAKLGLPLLDSRSPYDTIGRDTPPNPPNPRGPGGSVPKLTLGRGKKRRAETTEREALDRRMQEFLEHRPARLEISVNGETRTSQRVTADVNELHLKLNTSEEAKFIEVFSEQNVCLAYLHVTEPTLHPGLELRQYTALSDGRSLELTLAFANDVPTICVVYNDPIFDQVSNLQGIEDDLDLGAAAGVLPFSPREHKREPQPTLRPEPNLRQSLSARLLHWFQVFTPHRNPLFAGAIVLAIASACCLFFWRSSGPGITATAFLDRAQSRDSGAGSDQQAGVIFQRVRIKTPTGTTERTLYRDLQHRRRSKERPVNADDAKLKARLAEAGVDWNDPLSATTYRAWHNRKMGITDSVQRNGPDRLTLTSNVPDSEVVAESLTVRASDFHAVGKTIELRDYGTVEIAELNYDVMPPGAENPDWFEPLTNQAPATLQTPHAGMRLPHLLSRLELDRAELTARSMLHQLHADTGEPIRLVRGTNGVEINGVVDTDTRKRELLSRLALAPNVHASILTVEEIGVRATAHGVYGNGRPIQAYSLEAQPSPLEQYMRANHLPIDQLATLSQSLLDGGLKMNQAEARLSELEPRFKEAHQLPIELQNQLATLSRAYLESIKGGLDADQRTLQALHFRHGETPLVSDAQGGGLDQDVRRYQQLCLELIGNGTNDSRPATTIADELTETSDRIRLQLTRLSADTTEASN
jgi:DNA-directed RNA polymerase specialized sigma24 family protein